jgi:uncharacterized membrane protein
MADQATKSIMVQGPAAEVFKAWADFESFPHFMKSIKSVSRTTDRTTHWVAQGPLGKELQWDAETTRFEPDKRIAWRSIDGGDIKTSGQVTFNELGNGQVEVTVTMQWVIPPSLGGETLADLVAHPDRRLEEDLRNFKSYVEGRLVKQ